MDLRGTLFSMKVAIAASAEHDHFLIRTSGVGHQTHTGNETMEQATCTT